MFLPFDIPLVGKKALHRRSKTVSVVEKHQKSSQQKNYTPSIKTQRQSSKSTHVFKSILHKRPSQKQNEQFKSMRKMTQKIQQLIHKELQYPQFISSINRSLKRKQKNSSPQNNNPQKKNSFSDNFHMKKVNKLDQSRYRESQYLTLIKNSQRFNSKSFIPHFNWKQKLTRLKNMGNYGHIYKKKSQKIAEPTRVFIKSQLENQAFNSGKISLNFQNQNTFLQNFLQMKNLKKIKRYHTINQQVLEQKQIGLRRYNKTCLIGHKIYQSDLSSKKRKNFKLSKSNEKNTQRSDKEWNFEPWD